MPNYSELALQLHAELHGKLEVKSRCSVSNRDELSTAYTPGVAAPCLEIQKDVNNSYVYTNRANSCLVVTDGTAVLGLGDIGPEAGMPVMEGKCVLFKEFANIDAYPLCVKSKDVDEIVRTIYLISGSFGGINLEDISAPRCFEVERRLKELCDIPVFHDDQHGTAIVILSGVRNALRLTGRGKDARIVINGAGSAGMAIGTLLLNYGFEDVTMVDRYGALYVGNSEMNPAQAEIAKRTNKRMIKGTLADVIKDADVFIGVSAPNVLSKEMVQTMKKNPIIFACANPVPEIDPALAKEAGAYVIATGRSDLPNQLNNVLAFPGIFRGALDARASEINEAMKLAASDALTSLISNEELNPEYIIPAPFDKRVVSAVAAAVAKAAHDTGVARI
ncbi:MAG: NADP-dependent malic enzyme [Lachnospiraceae bacterium]|nr:NADP-dependent malic enzyme [Lachnospiraceae bacterium]